MTASPLSRARLLGGAVVLVAFAAGVATGMAIQRRPPDGVNVNITARVTNAIPRELEELGLTDPQRVEVRQILTRGRDRVMIVLRDFDPLMRAAVDSTQREIDAILTEAQRAALAEYRREHPAFIDQRIFKDASGKEIRQP